jgi:hypothetical protein
MTIRILRLSLMLAAMLVTLPALSQVGHPAKGSWSGYWGPGASDQRRMLLLLDWEDNKVTGTINPGRNGVAIERSKLDPANWTLTIEAEMPPQSDSGRAAHFVATGKLENLGSWSNRRYSGTYQLGDETGTFSLIIN